VKQQDLVKGRGFRWALAWLLAAYASMALALTHPQPGASADDLVQSADAVLAQLDAGKYRQVWHNMAPFAREAQPQTRFLKKTRQAREALGPVTLRGWAHVSRLLIRHATSAPPGFYATVDYMTELQSGRTALEHLSFWLDGNDQWRLTGYTAGDPPLVPSPNGLAR
jgi:hypothetical protein